MLVDDRRSAVALPETPLLAVLPGTGGLTRVTDKRKVRRDRADVFCSIEEGVRGSQGRRVAAGGRGGAQFEMERDGAPPARREIAARSDRPKDAKGIALTPLERKIEADRVSYSHVDVEIDRARGLATVTVRGPSQGAPASVEAAHALGAKFWPLTVARELEDAILHLRANEQTIGVVLMRTDGNAQAVLEHDDFLSRANGDWLMREIRHYLKRVLKRLDVTPRSMIALIEPGSCFAGTLAELAFAADRSLMLIGTREGDNRPPAAITLGQANFGFYPMGNGLTRLQTRFLGEPQTLGTRESKDWRTARGRGSRRTRPRHVRLRGFRLGRRVARHAGGARELLARRHDRHGGELALRRPGDHGNQDFRTADRLAELDLPAAERDRRAGRAQALRQRRVADLQ